jgi:hypothetical protein
MGEAGFLQQEIFNRHLPALEVRTESAFAEYNRQAVRINKPTDNMRSFLIFIAIV